MKSTTASADALNVSVAKEEIKRVLNITGQNGESVQITVSMVADGNVSDAFWEIVTDRFTKLQSSAEDIFSS